MPCSPPANERPVKQSEEKEDEVFSWRFGQLAGRDVPFSDAEVLAAARTDEADLEAMRRMLDKGCPPGLLRRVVLG